MRKVLSVSMFVSLLFFTTICLAADPLDQWHVRSSEAFTHDMLYDVAYGNGTWVAVGDHGTILASTDAITWTAAVSGTDRKLAGVTFGKGIFLAIGENGTILQSSDASTWTPCLSGTTANLEQIAFGNGIFGVVGSAGSLRVSQNGADWTAVNAGTGEPITGIAYGKGRFIAFSPTAGKVWFSRDGEAWNPHKVQNADRFLRLDFAGGRFFMDSGLGAPSADPYFKRRLRTSRNGLAWSSGICSDAFPVAYGKGVYAGRNYSSRDGDHWANDPVFGETAIYRIKYSPEARKFVAVGGLIFDSRDGLNWKKRSEGSCLGVAYGKNRFVAVGAAGRVRVSPDGSEWIEKNSGTRSTLWQVIYARGLFVAVGGTGTILTSPNGSIWTPRISGTTKDLFAVVYADGQFVATGRDYTILTSPDGISWTTQSDIGAWGMSELRSIAYGNNRYITACEGSNNYLISSDGIAWTSEHLYSWLSSYDIRVLFGKDKFLMSLSENSGSSQGLYILSSPDGSNWVEESQSESYGGLTGFADGVFFRMRSTDADASSFSLETSMDGSSWTTRETGIPEGTYANAVAFGAGTYVLVCDKGVILQSDPVAE